MAQLPGNLDYDFDEVIKYCKSSDTQSAMTNIVRDLNKLVGYLNTAENHFHCKGGSDTNALMQIYNGFSDAIGYSVGNNVKNADGVAKVNAYAAELFQACYELASNDKYYLAPNQWIWNENKSNSGGTTSTTTTTTTSPGKNTSYTTPGKSTSYPLPGKSTPNPAPPYYEEPQEIKKDPVKDIPDTGTVNRDQIDFDHVYRDSESAEKQVNNVYVSEKYQGYWGDTGDLVYEKRSNGTYLVTENGTALGWIDKDGIAFDVNNQVITGPRTGRSGSY